MVPMQLAMGGITRGHQAGVVTVGSKEATGKMQEAVLAQTSVSEEMVTKIHYWALEQGMKKFRFRQKHLVFRLMGPYQSPVCLRANHFFIFFWR